jgi:uncharacterized protein YuzE
MKINYAADVDALYITLTGNEIEETDEVSAGVMVDYDKDGNVVGLEVLNASASKDLERIIKQYVEQVKAA